MYISCKKYIDVYEKKSFKKIKRIDLKSEPKKAMIVGNYLFVLHNDSIGVIDLFSHTLVKTINTIKKTSDFLALEEYLYVVGRDPKGSNVQMFNLRGFL